MSFKNDGSGTMKFKVNLSSSRTKVSSVLALDSLNGQKIPSLETIKGKIEEVKNLLSLKQGITNVKVETNYSDYIFNLQFDFEDLASLEAALKSISINQSGNKSLVNQDFSWLELKDNELIRSVPISDLKSLFKVESDDYELLKKGTYLSITRFEKTIESAENPLSIISPNKLNLMVKTNTHSLYQNPKILDNVIKLNASTK